VHLGAADRPDEGSGVGDRSRGFDGRAQPAAPDQPDPPDPDLGNGHAIENPRPKAQMRPGPGPAPARHRSRTATPSDGRPGRLVGNKRALVAQLPARVREALDAEVAQLQTTKGDVIMRALRDQHHGSRHRPNHALSPTDRSRPSDHSDAGDRCLTASPPPTPSGPTSATPSSTSRSSLASTSHNSLPTCHGPSPGRWCRRRSPRQPRWVFYMTSVRAWVVTSSRSPVMIRSRALARPSAPM
jgi:hypothetical protein